jgi:hypothetical protein
VGVAKLSGLLVVFGALVLLSRYAKAQLEPPASPLRSTFERVRQWRPRSPDLSAVVRRFPRVASAPDVCTAGAEPAKDK